MAMHRPQSRQVPPRPGYAHRASLDHLRIFGAGSADRKIQPRRTTQPLRTQRRLSGGGGGHRLRRVAVVLAGMAVLVFLRSTIA
ncbi:MAG: hypothetical protein VYD87_08920 [Pseudomonadota bacterium]|nr:hypothetical protein [Pseudomonadota bacterium]